MDSAFYAKMGKESGSPGERAKDPTMYIHLYTSYDTPCPFGENDRAKSALASALPE